MFRHCDDTDDPLTQDEIVTTDRHLRRRTNLRRSILDAQRALDVVGVQRRRI